MQHYVHNLTAIVKQMLLSTLFKQSKNMLDMPAKSKENLHGPNSSLIVSSCRRSNSPLSAAELFRLSLPPSGASLPEYIVSASATVQSFQHHLKTLLFIPG